MPVAPAPWVESRTAGRTPVSAGKIALDAHLRPADPTDNRPPVPFPAGPDLAGMTGQFFMAILAGVIDPATPHPDGDDVAGAVIVNATSVGIHADASNRKFCNYIHTQNFLRSTPLHSISNGQGWQLDQ